MVIFLYLNGPVYNRNKVLIHGSYKYNSKTIMKTEGTIILKLFTKTHETINTFHVVGEEFGIQYGGILGRNFFEDKQSIINCWDQQMIMGDVVVKFDPKPNTANSESCKLTLKARYENVVKLPTKSMGHGLKSKNELRPGVYLAGPPLWSSGQSFWLQIQWSGVRFPALPDFLSSSGSGTVSTQPREVN